MATGFKLSIKFKQKRVQEQHECFKDGDSSGDGSELFPSSKKAKVLTLTLEDRTTKSKRLQDQGSVLAEHERYWEAIKYWNEALELTPNRAVLHEIKAQALLELDQVFPAVLSAEKAVQADPTWAPGLQTLGRAQLGLGEVNMALRNFEKAVHLDPANTELRQDDLMWAFELVQKKSTLQVSQGTAESEVID